MKVKAKYLQWGSMITYADGTFVWYGDIGRQVCIASIRLKQDGIYHCETLEDNNGFTSLPEAKLWCQQRLNDFVTGIAEVAE